MQVERILIPLALLNLIFLILDGLFNVFSGLLPLP
jgi:hypothetical protein